MSVLRLHAQAIWSHTCLLCPLSLARSLPPFLSISACDCSTTDGRGRVFYEEGGATNRGPGTPVCSFSETLTVLHASRGNLVLILPFSLSLSLSPSQQSACLSTVFLAFPGMLFCSLCPSVLHRLSFLLLRDSMHFWLIPTFAGLAERAGRQSCQFGHMTCYSQGLPEQEEGGEEGRREEERRGWGSRRECTAALPCGLPFFCCYRERFSQNDRCTEQGK